MSAAKTGGDRPGQAVAAAAVDEASLGATTGRVRRAPIRLIDVELTEPLPDVVADDGQGRVARSVRALVRLHGVPIGLVDAAFDAGRLSGARLADRIGADLAPMIATHLVEDRGGPAADGDVAVPGTSGAPAGPVTPGPAEPWQALREGGPDIETCRVRPSVAADPPSLSVVIPTRDRPERVLACIRSVLAGAFPVLEILVVDNAPSSDATAEALAQAAIPGVRYLREPRAGTSRARNLGLRLARGRLVAFLDDDVLVDRYWADALVAAFLADPDVSCVTGPIVAAELETEAQVLIEEYGGFDKGFRRKLFDPDDPPPGAPLFPYTAGTLGSGASMAFRRDALLARGGFDVALGGGTPARGGEDLAAFLGVLLAGDRIAYEPSMLVRHFHHRSYDRLRRVLLGYGLGLGAYLTRTVVVDPPQALEMARRARAGVAYVFSSDSPKNAKRKTDYPRELKLRELLGLGLGPFAYGWSRIRNVRRGGRSFGAVMAVDDEPVSAR